MVPDFKNICPKCGNKYDGAEVFCPKDGSRLIRASQMMEELDIPTVPVEKDSYVGRVIQDRYRVLEKLGEGGMGVVYVAEHVEIEKKVALKILREDFSKRPEVVERFRQEARSASKIGDPHIVDVTDFGQLKEGGVFFVMEHLQGRVLSDVMENDPLPLERAVPIITQIARALKAAHEKGIVHRDLKPENIFLVEREDNKDFVKVLDFGIAKISDRDSDGKRLTKTGMIFGTPEYMSPEQAAGKSLDHRVDVYALGCIMFEMFTGTVPFDGDTFMAVLTQHMFEPVPKIEMVNPETETSEAIRAVVYKAMAKDLSLRYPDMSALEMDLERAMEDSSYAVDFDETEATQRLPLANERVAVPRTKDSKLETIDTTINWSPQPTPYPQKKGRLASVMMGVAAFVIVGGGIVAYSTGLFGTGQGREDAAVNGNKVASIAPLVFNKPDAGTQGERESLSDAGTGVTADAGGKARTDTDQGEKETSLVAVSIKSEPKGATVSIEGLGQVCSATPCEVKLETGRSVEISGALGKRSDRRIFTPSEQNKELTLVVKRSRGSSRSQRNKGKTGSSKQGASSTSKTDSSTGLKIPDVFKDN